MRRELIKGYIGVIFTILGYDIRFVYWGYIGVTILGYHIRFRVLVFFGLGFRGLGRPQNSLVLSVNP